MAHLYKTQEWQSPSGKWYCNDTTELAGMASKWWVPARILGISLTDYVLLLKNKYNATIVKYNLEKDILIFYWDKQVDCHKYVLAINAAARKKVFTI